MPSRREAFEWVNKARELWPPDINKILECYKKAEELRPDYHIIYKDKARLFHGLERFPEAVANYDLEIQKRRYDYEINKKSPPEKFETDEEREEFERGQIVMEEMFESMKQVRDKAAQKIEPEVIYPWEDQIMYFSVVVEVAKDKLALVAQNAIKNCLEKVGHARKYYHILASTSLQNEIVEEIELATEKLNKGFAHDPDFEKGLDMVDKKFVGAERALDNPKVEEAIKKFVKEYTEKWFVTHIEEITLIAQKILEKKLLKTDHEN